MLVLTKTEYNKQVPVIIGTNDIHDVRESLSNAKKVPLEWETAFDAIQSDRVGIVKTTRKVTLQPNETKTLTCLYTADNLSNAKPAVQQRHSGN